LGRGGGGRGPALGVVVLPGAHERLVAERFGSSAPPEAGNRRGRPPNSVNRDRRGANPPAARHWDQHPNPPHGRILGPGAPTSLDLTSHRRFPPPPATRHDRARPRRHHHDPPRRGLHPFPEPFGRGRPSSDRQGRRSVSSANTVQRPGGARSPWGGRVGSAPVPGVEGGQGAQARRARLARAMSVSSAVSASSGIRASKSATEFKRPNTACTDATTVTRSVAGRSSASTSAQRST
jgi:hypothetical protein